MGEGEGLGEEEEMEKSDDGVDNTDRIGMPNGLEGPPLAEVWLPGRILHLYSHRGVYQASFVPRTFSTLRVIEVQGNIFDDHKTVTIFNALLEVGMVSLFEPPPCVLSV